MSYEAKGTLHKKYETEKKTETFQAREFVLKVEEGNYAQFVKFQLVQDRCAIIDDMNEGEELLVTFDLRGREWNGKYFTNLNAWKVDRVQTAAPADSGDDFPTLDDEPPVGEEEDGDLPF